VIFELSFIRGNLPKNVGFFYGNFYIRCSDFGLSSLLKMFLYMYMKKPYTIYIDEKTAKECGPWTINPGPAVIYTC
jgi:hypothetical protein